MYGRWNGVVLVADDLALLGQLDATHHAPRGLGQDRAVCRSPTACDGTSPTVKELDAHALLAPLRCELALDAVQTPARRQVAAVLHRV